jgi:hypothetical protein
MLRGAGSKRDYICWIMLIGIMITSSTFQSVVLAKRDPDRVNFKRCAVRETFFELLKFELVVDTRSWLATVRECGRSHYTLVPQWLIVPCVPVS